MKKGIIYCRVSSHEQVQGTSLDNQERACLEFAKRQDIEIKKVFVERGESATAANRTEFLNALDYCKEHKGDVNAFIVWKVDRFARNTTDHFAVRAKLTQYGVNLMSVTEPITQDHMGKLMETFLAGYAEFENEVRKQRCTGGMQARLREGIWCWWPPIGYVNSKNRLDRRKLQPDEPDPERFFLIQKGLRLYKEGNHTICELSDISSKWGLRTRTGQPMRKQLWETILTDKFYAGILVNPWTKEEYTGKHKPMISLDEFDQIQMVKRGLSNNATTKRHSTNPDFPLRRSVRCTCGDFLTASWRTGRSKKYPYYHCNNKGCPNYTHAITKGDIEKEFVDYLNRINPDERFLKIFEECVIEVWKNRYSSIEQESDYYKKELARLESRRKELMEMRINQEISKEDFQDMKDKIDNQITGIKISHNETETDKFDLESSIAYATQFISNLSKQWLDMGIKQQQRLQKVVFPQGLVYDKTTKMFGTAILSPVFRLSGDFVASKSELVAGAGIEPAISRL